MNPDISLKELIHTIAEERGLDLRGYKQSTLQRRIRKRMFQIGIPNFSEYLERVRTDQDEVRELLNTVLINVTEFFRDPQAWDTLRSTVVRILGSMRPGDSFRAWCAGCASGEEPFSLAIMIADYLGPKLPEYDIKIYATDVDEDALNVARRGEYPVSSLRRLRPEWREKFFTGKNHLRVNRDIRRMVIFGRSNLVSDAPISHCNLVICRNVLIYFDAITQKHVLARLHYALEPAGILFLGKAESKLSESRTFRQIHPRWRIFQRIDKDWRGDKPEGLVPTAMVNDEQSKYLHEIERLRLHYRYLLDTLKAGIVVLDAADVVTNCNDTALGLWGLGGLRILGERLQNTDLVYRCPELATRVQASRVAGHQSISFECRVATESAERTLSVTIRPVLAEDNGERTGTIIYTEDITSREKLQDTIEQLEATSEELQSANEELETTNEELQSTNEELETTNEELQSTNEELETTNEELQSLNEELENMNDQLETRTRELNSLTDRYAETLKRLPWPVMLVDREEKIQLWNSAAQRLFGVGVTSVVGVEIEQLPMELSLKNMLVRRCRAVLGKGKPATVRGQQFGSAVFDVQFTPISRDESIGDGIMVMFGPFQSGKGDATVAGRGNGKSSQPTDGKSAKDKSAVKGSKAAKENPKPRAKK